MVKQDYVSLHPSCGGPARGYRCEVVIEWRTKAGENFIDQCAKVTRSERGMKLHLLWVHGIKQQAEMFLKAPQANENKELIISKNS